MFDHDQVQPNTSKKEDYINQLYSERFERIRK